MKGALAAAICGVGEAARSGGSHRQVAVSASVLEETIEGVALGGCPRPDAARRRSSSASPPRSTIKHGQRGRIEILSRSADIPSHAAYPERGKNPLLLAAAALQAHRGAWICRADPDLGKAIMVPTDIISSLIPRSPPFPRLVTSASTGEPCSDETSACVLDALRLRLAGIDPRAFEVQRFRRARHGLHGQGGGAERDLLALAVGDRHGTLAQAAAASLVDWPGVRRRYRLYSFCTNGSEIRRTSQHSDRSGSARARRRTPIRPTNPSRGRGILQAAATYRHLCLRPRRCNPS